MSRAASWYPLAWGDPVPGEPDAVRAAGVRYGDLAVRVDSAATDLGELGAGLTGRSQAAEALQAQASVLAGQVGEVGPRYRTVGSALVEYAVALAGAQERAGEALADGRRAAAATDEAAGQVRLWGARAVEAADEGERAVAEQRLEQARVEVAGADRRLEVAREVLVAAERMRDGAAARAVEVIHAVHGDGLDDSLWDTLGAAVSTLGQVLYQVFVQPVVDAAVWVWDHAGSISGRLAGVCLVLGWVPVLGPVLDVVALAVGVLVLAKSIYDLVQDGGTSQGWCDVGVAALGVATFGIARVAGQGLKMAARAAKTTRTGATAGRITEAGSSAGAAATRVTRVGKDMLSQGAVARQGSTSAVVKELFSVLKPSSVVEDLADDLSRARVFTRWSAPAGAPAHAISSARQVMDEGVKGLTNPHTGWANVLGMGRQVDSITIAAPTTAGKAAIGAVGAVKTLDITLKVNSLHGTGR